MLTRVKKFLYRKFDLLHTKVLLSKARYDQRIRAGLYVNGWEKNKHVMLTQLADYFRELELHVFPGIKNASGPVRKVHKYSAILEEAFDKMPRFFFYRELLFIFLFNSIIIWWTISKIS